MGRLAAVFLSTAFAIGVMAKDEKSSIAHPTHAPLPEYPANLLAEGVEGSVDVGVEVDSKGRILHIKVRESTDLRFEAACEEAIRGWKFEPAKYFGRSAGGFSNVTILFKDGSVSMQEEADPNEKGVPPKVVKQVAPIYPESLLKSGNLGKVVIDFVVDREGKVRNPKIVTSTHPAFEAPAVDALLQWKFEPGVVNGTRVDVNMRLPLSFNLPATGVEAFKMTKKSAKNVPEVLKIDVPPRPKLTVFVVHPYEHAISGASGTAEVKVLVSPEGTALGSLVVKASKPEYGLALAAAMEAWTFTPALRDKKPTLASISRKHTFETRTRDSAIDKETAELASLIRKGRFKPASAKELDAPLRPLFTAQPVYPTAMVERAVAGSAKIEVIVDKKGRAVLPRIVEASEPEFGWAAATAVQRWQFEPPTVGGKPVEVKVVIPVKFTAPERPPSGETS